MDRTKDHKRLTEAGWTPTRTEKNGAVTTQFWKCPHTGKEVRTDTAIYWMNYKAATEAGVR